MGLLTDSPSGGESEVLATLRAEGRNVPFARLCERVRFDWGLGSDDLTSYPDTVASVLSGLTPASVTGTTANGGAVVDLTDGTPDDTDRIIFTNAGLASARHLSPRPQRIH